MIPESLTPQSKSLQAVSDTSNGLRRELNLLDSTMINVGSIIASAIFIVPASIAGHLPSTSMILLVWVLGGVVSLFGALSIAELGALMPRAGGQFVFLREIYSPLWGFLYGWSAFVVIISGSISAIAVAFATYLAFFIPLDDTAIKTIAIASILLLTVINCFGVKLGAWIQNGFTFSKIAALGLLILFSFMLSGGSLTNFQPLLPADSLTSMLGPFGISMIAVLWAYDGWIEITFVAGEVKNPDHNVHRSLILSTIIIIVLYLLINVAYVYVLSIEQLSQSTLVASDAATVIMGPAGASFVTLAVILSTFGANNGYVFTGARIYYAMAKEGVFFESLATVHPKYKTPIPSLLAQGGWACFLVLTGTYEQLFTYVIFASWVFYAMSCFGVFLLRKRWPNVHRPYKTWGYPYTPGLFIAFSFYLIANAIVENPRDSIIGAMMMVSGIPAYFYWRRKIKTDRHS
ncbi:MAG TPA: amino acid permease [Bacteroidota bacterium]|nr:amino acid permease [Bacteroidota bacterium]